MCVNTYVDVHIHTSINLYVYADGHIDLHLDKYV